MIRFFRLASLILGSLLVLSLALVVLRDQNAQTSYVIAFQSFRNGNWDIYTMLVDGSNVRALTHDESMQTNPRWSPDGAWIAFESRGEGTNDIFIMRPDGRQKRNLTRGIGICTQPVWSPDSRRIAFRVEEGHHSYVYVVERDGSKIRKLTPNRSPGTSLLWSPDGEWLFFVGQAVDDSMVRSWDVHRIRPDGSDNEFVMSIEQPIRPRLRYSWDRQHLLYTTQLGEVASVIMGQDRELIDRSMAREVQWNAEGSYALYQASFGRSTDIWRVEPGAPCQEGELCLQRLDFDGATNLTNHPDLDQNASWSPLIDHKWRLWQTALLGLGLLGVGLQVRALRIP